MKTASKISCEDLRAEFEKISPEDDIGRIDLRSTSQIREHLKICSTCKKWVDELFKRFVK